MLMRLSCFNRMNLIQGCKLFHRLQTHSILTAIVTRIECSCRTGPPLPTNRDLPAGSPNLATTEENRQGWACWSPLLSFPAAHASYEIGCKQTSSFTSTKTRCIQTLIVTVQASQLNGSPRSF